MLAEESAKMVLDGPFFLQTALVIFRAQDFRARLIFKPLRIAIRRI